MFTCAEIKESTKQNVKYLTIQNSLIPKCEELKHKHKQNRKKYCKLKAVDCETNMTQYENESNDLNEKAKQMKKYELELKKHPKEATLFQNQMLEKDRNQEKLQGHAVKTTDNPREVRFFRIFLTRVSKFWGIAIKCLERIQLQID